MDKRKLDNLTRDIPIELEENAPSGKKYEEVRHIVRNICRSMMVSTIEYIPSHTILEIKKFFAPDMQVYRILYSEISSLIMPLEAEGRGEFCSNVENLLFTVIDPEYKDEYRDDIVKIVFKIYDHAQLVTTQIDVINKMIAPLITEAKEQAKLDIHSEIKGIEREYITILGIFATIIIGFVGTFTFSTSVLNNIGNASWKMLTSVSITIGIVFYMIISLLIKFLYEINGKDFSATYNDKIALIMVFVTLGIVLGIICFA